MLLSNTKCDLSHCADDAYPAESMKAAGGKVFTKKARQGAGFLRTIVLLRTKSVAHMRKGTGLGQTSQKKTQLSIQKPQTAPYCYNCMHMTRTVLKGVTLLCMLQLRNEIKLGIAHV